MWLYGVQFPTYKSSMCFVFCFVFYFYFFWVGGGGVKSVKATPQGSGLLEVV